MRITRITEQVKNKDRVSIYIDGAYAFSLLFSQLFDEKLKVDTELSDGDIKRLEKLSDEGKLRMRTLEWLLLRPRSAKELHDYLKRKQLDPEEIIGWQAQFQKQGYQNDEQFARWWVEQRRNKQRSARYIAGELRSKGVSTEIITEILAAEQTSDSEALILLIAKKQQNIRYQDDKKLTEYLMRQGYRYSDILAALAE